MVVSSTWDGRCEPMHVRKHDGRVLKMIDALSGLFKHTQ